MKLFKIILITMVFMFVAYAGDMRLDSFTAQSSGVNIVLEWRTSMESGINHFDIERKATNEQFKFITTLKAKGPSTYTFTDEGIFSGTNNGQKNLQSTSTYSYRLKSVYVDGSSAYSNTIYLAHNISSVQRTWGMIKEMFR